MPFTFLLPPIKVSCRPLKTSGVLSGFLEYLSVDLLVQIAHNRCFVPSKLSTVPRLCVQRAQKISPHFRQWCLRRIKPNSTLQFILTFTIQEMRLRSIWFIYLLGLTLQCIRNKDDERSVPYTGFGVKQPPNSVLSLCHKSTLVECTYTPYRGVQLIDVFIYGANIYA